MTRSPASRGRSRLRPLEAAQFRGNLIVARRKVLKSRSRQPTPVSAVRAATPWIVTLTPDKRAPVWSSDGPDTPPMDCAPAGTAAHRRAPGHATSRKSHS